MKKCLDKPTIDKMLDFESIIADPMSLITHFNLTKDIGLFSEGAQILQDINTCAFQKSIIDLVTFCMKGNGTCNFQHLTENFTKNMFVLMGKAT